MQGPRREFELEDFWPHKGRIVLKFRGVDSISDAEVLAGWEIQIPRQERTPLEPGAAYVSDLVGCQVVADGQELGPVTAVQFGAGPAPYWWCGKEPGRFFCPWRKSLSRNLTWTGARCVCGFRKVCWT